MKSEIEPSPCPFLGGNNCNHHKGGDAYSEMRAVDDYSEHWRLSKDYFETKTR